MDKKSDSKFSNESILEIIVALFIAFTMVFLFVKIMFF